jgi:SHS2 domain-containing protein
MPDYTILPHTADIGVRARGTTLPELFVNAAAGMLSFLAATAPAAPAAHRTVQVRGADDESLLVNWLNELLYLVAVERFFPVAMSIRRLERGVLEAALDGSVLPPEVRQPREIKAATYSNLQIEHTARGYAVSVIFDV